MLVRDDPKTPPDELINCELEEVRPLTPEDPPAIVEDVDEMDDKEEFELREVCKVDEERKRVVSHI